MRLISPNSWRGDFTKSQINEIIYLRKLIMELIYDKSLTVEDKLISTRELVAFDRLLPCKWHRGTHDDFLVCHVKLAGSNSIKETIDVLEKTIKKGKFKHNLY